MNNPTDFDCSTFSTDFDWAPFAWDEVEDFDCCLPINEIEDVVSPEELEQIERDYQEWLAEKDLFDMHMDTSNWQGDRYYDDGFDLGW